VAIKAPANAKLDSESASFFHGLIQQTTGFGPQTARMTNAVFGLATVLLVGF
jgi:hypothetical protein